MIWLYFRILHWRYSATSWRVWCKMCSPEVWKLAAYRAWIQGSKGFSTLRRCRWRREISDEMSLLWREYSLKELYKKCFTKAMPYKLCRYIKNEHYQMLSESRNRKLLEFRLMGIENNVKKIQKKIVYNRLSCLRVYFCRLPDFLLIIFWWIWKT